VMSPMRAQCSSHLTLFDSIGEAPRRLYAPAIFLLLHPNILLSSLLSNTWAV
jgi:hypothetical protein